MNSNRHEFEFKCGCVMVAEGVKVVEMHLCKDHTKRYMEIISTPQYQLQLKLGLIPKNRPKIFLYKKTSDEE